MLYVGIKTYMYRCEYSMYMCVGLLEVKCMIYLELWYLDVNVLGIV